MLILTRKVGTAVIIEGKIKIKVLEIKHKEVAFGIDAPNEVAVHRQEIYEKIVKDQQQFIEKLKLKKDSSKK